MNKGHSHLISSNLTAATASALSLCINHHIHKIMANLLLDLNFLVLEENLSFHHHTISLEEEEDFS